ncbi:dentin sialophosphoprotein precursor, putative [Trichomonas vaginalis G3]|uniref:Dentin sialophosphoprotein, putative n=1 Tax=Trichomonas vaginalis (strain ATCC PRA-98 / G3) TaxID=412133 RepID=A2DGB9_TRIV3|nr:hypothetical protein TVAGG3_0966940 [Trichomonas vaginalis G3]EAY20515.1 dentin sialophosphoprotein precursor, putative [Trichomonas vaginalis G3]KAI5488309.1 hypothetical protein TVAGG3_0966940 [Trichomonas vaginalis G3]|eukprot:XP_001581501.1 dentin sialophosphoprotein precursor [Trichomonas vaginalis G3]
MSKSISQAPNSKNALLKELIRTSPKKYTAILLSDSEDEGEKKAILISDSELDDDEDEYANTKAHKQDKYNNKNDHCRFDNKPRNQIARGIDFSSDEDDDFDDDDDTYTSFAESDYSNQTGDYSAYSNSTYQSKTYSSYSGSAVSSQYSHCSDYSEKKVCPRCSKVLSSDSYLSSEDESEDESESLSSDSELNSDSFDDSSDSFELPVPKFNKTFDPRKELAKQRREAGNRAILEKRAKCENIPTPQVIVSPKKPSPMRLRKLSNLSKVDEIIQKRKEKLIKEKEAERKRMEEEAMKKAQEEMEQRRKESVKNLLESLGERKAHPQRYVALYRRHRKYIDSDSESEALSSSDNYSDDSEF